jgi:hypothetical protein
MLNLWYLGGRIGKIIRNNNIIDNELNTLFTYQIIWYYIGIYSQVNTFKSKLNSLIIELRISKPNHTNIS